MWKDRELNRVTKFCNAGKKNLNKSLNKQEGQKAKQKAREQVNFGKLPNKWKQRMTDRQMETQFWMNI